MRAFKYENGHAVPVEWTDPRMKVPLPVTNMRVTESNGFRYSQISDPYLIWIAWGFANTITGERIALYLPEGVEPTDEHHIALAVAMAQPTITCPHCGGCEFSEILRTPLGRPANETHVRCRQCANDFVAVF